MTLTKDQVHEVMLGIQPEWRYYWCRAQVCGCMGGANCSGNASAKGVTQEQWEHWVALNPKPDNQDDVNALIRLLNIGSIQSQQGDTMTVAELKDRLRQRFYDPTNKPSLP